MDTKRSSESSSSTASGEEPTPFSGFFVTDVSALSFSFSDGSNIVAAVVVVDGIQYSVKTEENYSDDDESCWTTVERVFHQKARQRRADDKWQRDDRSCGSAGDNTESSMSAQSVQVESE